MNNWEVSETDPTEQANQAIDNLVSESPRHKLLVARPVRPPMKRHHTSAQLALFNDHQVVTIQDTPDP